MWSKGLLKLDFPKTLLFWQETPLHRRLGLFTLFTLLHFYTFKLRQCRSNCEYWHTHNKKLKLIILVTWMTVNNCLKCIHRRGDKGILVSSPLHFTFVPVLNRLAQSYFFFFVISSFFFWHFTKHYSTYNTLQDSVTIRHLITIIYWEHTTNKV